MSEYTNLTNVPLSLAVYLATDHYDRDPTAISATSLMKPLRQIVLGPRVPQEFRAIDIISLVKSRMGTSIHDGIEKVWMFRELYEEAMRKLGHSEAVIKRIAVNPSREFLEENPDTIPIFMEQRLYRQLDDKKISGKFDFIAQGRLEDFKSTSVYTWINDTKDEDYQLQGSIYRWLDPELITEDYMVIQFLFTDWAPAQAKSNPKYPAQPTLSKRIPLLDLKDTEDFIRQKLRAIDTYSKLPEESLPRCTDKELWRKDSVWKYYKNPNKLSRSTKNFDTPAEAYAKLAEDGNVGVVIEKPGEVVACKYCPVFPICTQKDDLIADGSLVIEP